MVSFNEPEQPHITHCGCPECVAVAALSYAIIESIKKLTEEQLADETQQLKAVTVAMSWFLYDSQAPALNTLKANRYLAEKAIDFEQSDEAQQ